MKLSEIKCEIDVAAKIGRYVIKGWRNNINMIGLTYIRQIWRIQWYCLSLNVCDVAVLIIVVVVVALISNNFHTLQPAIGSG
jgi:hypothetical protein